MVPAKSEKGNYSPRAVADLFMHPRDLSAKSNTDGSQLSPHGGAGRREAAGRAELWGTAPGGRKEAREKGVLGGRQQELPWVSYMVSPPY